MLQLVTKRDGKVAPFRIEQVRLAVQRADFNSQLPMTSINRICNYIASLNLNRIDVEEIQNLIESELLKESYDVYSQFKDYREERTRLREVNSKLYNDIHDMINSSSTSEVKDENANKDSTILSTKRDLLAGIVSKHQALQHLLPKNISIAHTSGDIHFHDLDYSPLFPLFNCMLIDLKTMFTDGYSMGNTSIEPPKSLKVAGSQTSQIIAQVASSIYGGTSISGIDEILAPYVSMSYDKYLDETKDLDLSFKDRVAFCKAQLEKEVYDTMQALEYEVNTLNTTNGQTPFITFGFGLGTSEEAKLIQKALLNVRLKGLGKNGDTAIFPKLVYAVKKGHNYKEGDPFYDVKKLAIKCTANRIYPDVVSYDNIVKTTGSFKFPMGCRSFLSSYQDEHGNEVTHGRNNIGVVSLNIPRLALEVRHIENHDERLRTFFDLLEKKIQLCHEALMLRFNRFKDVKASVAPILYTSGAMGVKLKPTDDIDQLFKNGRATISLGYIGLHEALLLLTEQQPIESQSAQELGLQIVKLLSDSCVEMKEKTGLAFSLYSTPAENLCKRFCELDREKFGSIPNITDKKYYTNSFHLDVNHNATPFEKIDFEKHYPKYTSGGFITYVEFPSMNNNLEALETFWDYAIENTPYFGTNTPVDRCHECKFEGEFDASTKGFVCPNCGNSNVNTINVTRRVCGYLGSPTQRSFNEGKTHEVLRRVKHFGE